MQSNAIYLSSPSLTEGFLRFLGYRVTLIRERLEVTRFVSLRLACSRLSVAGNGRRKESEQEIKRGGLRLSVVGDE